MPTYDYVCKACDHCFEYFQKMSDGAIRKCPECGALKLKRLMGTGAGVIFKGSGFYETDYKRKSSGNGSASRYTSRTEQKESEQKETEKKESEKKEAKKSEPSTSKKADD